VQATRGRSSPRTTTGRQGVGQIKSITDFGIFIGLDGGIDGLVHLSDISWDIPGEEAVRNLQKGQRSRPWCCDRSGARAHLARHQAARAHEEQQAMDSYRSESGGSTGTTLGELLKEQISNSGDS
jgi:ribosomal protein S1